MRRSILLNLFLVVFLCIKTYMLKQIKTKFVTLKHNKLSSVSARCITKRNKASFIDTSCKWKIPKHKKKKIHLSNHICILDLSDKLIDYGTAYELQHFLHIAKLILKNQKHNTTLDKFELKELYKVRDLFEKWDFCLILQHPPSYTLGSSGKIQDILLEKTNYYVENLVHKYNDENSSTILQYVRKWKRETPKMQNYDEQKDYFSEFIQNLNKQTPIPIPIYKINRGGKATFHGPGQLIIYFIFNLKNYAMNYQTSLPNNNEIENQENVFKQTNNDPLLDKKQNDTNIDTLLFNGVLKNQKHFDLHKTMDNFQQISMDIIRRLNVETHTNKGEIGVFYKDKKLVSIGLKIRKFISMHGLSMNFHIDKRFLEFLLPCGMDHSKYTSLHQIEEIQKLYMCSRKEKKLFGHKLLKEVTQHAVDSITSYCDAKITILKNVSDVFDL